jgi:regulator of protease activity HflC (stomatin/prohibitin superfamily)
MFAERYQKFRLWIAENTPTLIVFGLLFTLAFAVLWPRIVVSVQPGEGGVLYKRLFVGTVVDYVYPEGLHVLLPWNHMTIYDSRVQLVMHEFDVLTNKGLPIHLRIAVRFHPEYELLGVLHQQVGPDYVHKIILPQIESVLRKNIGQHNPEDIYTNKEGILSRIIVLALEETGRKYVRIDDIIIRSLELPEPVRKAIEEKLVYEQQYQAYDFRLKKEKQEAERKRIEAEGIRDYQATISATLNEQLILWQGVEATLQLAQSPNSKVVVVGAGKNGLPIILGDKFLGDK